MIVESRLIIFCLSLHVLSATAVCPSLHLSAGTRRSASSTRVSGSPCRSVESPLALLPDAAALEDDVIDSKTWQETVTPQLLATLSPSEVDRQAVIYGKSYSRYFNSQYNQQVLICFYFLIHISHICEVV